MGMTSLRDLLVYYNNCDVVPFLTALAHQCHLYKESGLDMLKDAPSLPGLGLRYGMKGLEGVFHTFSPGQADLAQLVMSSIVGGPSLVFCRLAEVGHTRIRSPDYGADALVCKALVGYDANSLYPWGMSCEMPVGPCLVRHEPNFEPELTEHGRSGPRHSRASLQWLAYEAVKLGYQDIQHAGNGPEVRVGQRHIPVDGYHAESATVFQFYGCVFHGHGCTLTRASADAWLGSEASDRRKSTDEIEHYLEDTCGYTLVTIWECQWEALKRNDPEARQQTEVKQTIHVDPTSIATPGADKSSVLQAIEEGKIFGFALVDIHTPEELKNKFRDLPPIFKCCDVSQDDIGDHKQDFCKRTGALARPRRMLISSYFGIKMLIPTPLLRWYLQQGLTVTRVYLVIQYQPQEFSTVQGWWRYLVRPIIAWMTTAIQRVWKRASCRAKVYRRGEIHRLWAMKPIVKFWKRHAPVAVPTQASEPVLAVTCIPMSKTEKLWHMYTLKDVYWPMVSIPNPWICREQTSWNTTSGSSGPIECWWRDRQEAASRPLP